MNKGYREVAESGRGEGVAGQPVVLLRSRFGCGQSGLCSEDEENAAVILVTNIVQR